MGRVEHIGDATLYLGDCLDVMPTLDNVDVVVTDPPYELSKSGPGESHFGMSLNKFDSDEYKSIVSGFDLGALVRRLDMRCDPYNAFIFCSNKQISRLMQMHEMNGWATTLIVWHKTNAVPFANGVWRGDIEYCVHARGKGAVFNGGASDKTKVTPHPIVQDTAHPTVKPIAIISKYIKIGSDLGQTVLDPFMGSGTTGVACAKLGRKFVGIELEPKYFEISCERIQKAYDHPDMFIGPPKKQTQEIMDL